MVRRRDRAPGAALHGEHASALQALLTAADAGQETVVKIELQVVADCRHEAPTAQLLRRALDDVGLPTTRFTTVVVTGHEHAEQLRFTGSPTIRIDGVDPFADPAWLPQ